MSSAARLSGHLSEYPLLNLVNQLAEQTRPVTPQAFYKLANPNYQAEKLNGKSLMLRHLKGQSHGFKETMDILLCYSGRIKET